MFLLFKIKFMKTFKKLFIYVFNYVHYWGFYYSRRISIV